MNYDIKTISRIKDIVCEHSPTYEDIKNDRNVMFEFYNIIQERHASWFSSGNLDLSTGKKIHEHLLSFKTIHPKNKLLYDVVHRDCFCCMMCGRFDKPKGFHIDHILPKSKFPISHPWKLQLLCKKCNLDKSDKILDNIIPILLDGAIIRSNKYYNSDEKLIKKATIWADTVYDTTTIVEVEKIIISIIDKKIPWRNVIK